MTASATSATAVADLRLGADARARPQPDRGGRPARPDRAASGRRRRDRAMIGPFDVEFIPVTHSVPHAHAIAVHTPQGVILHSGDFKLDLTPVDGRRTDLAAARPARAGEGIRLLMADSTNAEEHGYAPSETIGRRGAAVAVRRAPRAADHHRQLRQPPPPHPADRRRRDRGRPQGRHARAEHEEERAPRAATSACSRIPDVVADRHRGHRRLRARQGLRDLHRFAGRADVGAGAARPRREQVGQARRARHGDPVEPRHPRQREQRQPA